MTIPAGDGDPDPAPAPADDDGDDSSPTDPESILNVNVGVLGHVDSGKTSLVKALSTLLSTAGTAVDSRDFRTRMTGGYVFRRSRLSPTLFAFSLRNET
jgi:hypothetical protein